MARLKAVMMLLIVNDNPLGAEWRDHALAGEWSDHVRGADRSGRQETGHPALLGRR